MSHNTGTYVVFLSVQMRFKGHHNTFIDSQLTQKKQRSLHNTGDAITETHTD